METLTNYTLRRDLGAAQPRPDAWLRLRTRLQTGSAVPARLEPTFSDRFWRNLLVVGPRLSSMGVALAMLALFVHTSLIPLAPPVPNTDRTQPSSVPPVKLIYLDTVGIAPVATAPEPDPSPHLVPLLPPAPVDVADPLVRSRYGASSTAPVDSPQVKPNPRN